MSADLFPHRRPLAPVLLAATVVLTAAAAAAVVAAPIQPSAPVRPARAVQAPAAGDVDLHDLVTVESTIDDSRKVDAPGLRVDP